jgi:hypothetical protein
LFTSRRCDVEPDVNVAFVCVVLISIVASIEEGDTVSQITLQCKVNPFARSFASQRVYPRTAASSPVMNNHEGAGSPASTGMANRQPGFSHGESVPPPRRDHRLQLA